MKTQFPLSILSVVLASSSLCAMDAPEADPTEARLKFLQQRIPLTVLDGVATAYLDCCLRMKDEEEGRIVNFTNENGYVLDTEHFSLSYTHPISSIKSSYHDPQYTEVLRQSDHVPFKGLKVALSLVPVQGPKEIEGYLNWCHATQKEHRPIPYFGLIDYRNFLAWRIELDNPSAPFSAYVTAIIKRSTVSFVEIKYYAPRNETFAQNGKAVLSAMVAHFARPSRASKLDGYQFEIPEGDGDMEALAVWLNCVKSFLTLPIGLKFGTENGRRYSFPDQIMGALFYNFYGM